MYMILMRNSYFTVIVHMAISPWGEGHCWLTESWAYYDPVGTGS
ncbi:hypothetical protein [Kroppenstedtia pulmonis]|nr:hypothetical protein [Kroppenstedtia pulmonis]